MFKRGCLFLLALLLVVSLVSAVSFDVSEEAVKATIRPDEPAIFELTIVNNAGKEDVFRLSTMDIAWSIQSVPLYHYFGGVTIPARSTEKVTLMLYPPYDVRYGQNKIALDVKSVNTGEIVTRALLVNVRTSVPLIRDYFAAVNKIVDFDPKINPSEKLSIDINLENKNPKNITDLRVGLSSKFFQKEIVTTLGPWERKTLQAEIILDPTLAPQDDVLAVTLFVNGQALDPVLKEPFKIVGYSGIRVEKRPVVSSFLETVEETVYYNDGNTIGTKFVERPVGFFEAFFTGSSPAPSTIVREGKRYLAWELSIQPQARAAVKVTTNYRLLFALLVVSVFGVVLYYLFRSPVVVRKEALVVGLKEGGISDLKVVLNIKNRSGRPFDKITLVDRIPHITQIEKDFDAGTLKPTNIVQKVGGTIVKWEIDSLDKFEERVVSYRIRSKLSILGAFALPKALLKFSTEGGAERVVSSNRVRVKE